MTRLQDIAASLAGYDPEALRVDEVHAFLSRLAASAQLGHDERIALGDALGRVLSEDIVSPFSVPPHDNSAMDGFAFDGALLPDAEALARLPADASLELRVVGIALAGVAWRGAVGDAEAVRIMTGALMPSGLDTVVAQEFCVHEGDRVRFPVRALRRGANRRRAGEDLQQGQAALRLGTIVSPAALGMMASLGLAHVPVRRRWRRWPYNASWNPP